MTDQPPASADAGLEPGLVARRDAEGAFARPLQALLTALRDGPRPLAELVRASGMPRRRVEAVLAELAQDLVTDDDGTRLRPDRADAYATAFDLDDDLVRAAVDPWAHGLAGADLVERIRTLTQDRPAPDRQLDHVAATAETAARRAVWLDRTYDLARTRILCVGDHDLTSLATAAANPAAEIMVADIDDRILAFIDATARREGWTIQCVWGDFRLGLPAAALGWADLVFTDPPYTPEGVETFLVAGLQGLREPERGRVVMAYGFGDHQPALGLKVQQAVQNMQVAFEAILPDFNHYEGAQAIGSRSDLYVCRPTARTWRALTTLADRQRMQIYTHGEQSLEAQVKRADAAVGSVIDTVRRESGDGALLLATQRSVAAGQTGGATQHTYLSTLLAQGVPQQLAGRTLTVVADLDGAPASWLPRLLLAANAAELAVLVPTAYAYDAVDTLQPLVEDKYRLRVTTVGEATLRLLRAQAVGPETEPPGSVLVRRVLSRTHGKLANVWREALIAASRRSAHPLSKNEARALVAEHCTRPTSLGLGVVELPLDALAQLVTDLRASEQALEA